MAKIPELTPEERLAWVEGQIAEKTRRMEELTARYEEIGLTGAAFATKKRELEDQITLWKERARISDKQKRRIEQLWRLCEAFLKSRNQ